MDDTSFAGGSSGDKTYLDDLTIRVDGGVMESKSYQKSPNSSANMFLITNKNCKGITSVMLILNCRIQPSAISHQLSTIRKS
jgi:hypothetical protein